MSLTLALDCGTTNLKAGVVGPTGEILSHSRRPIQIHSPEPEAAEHDPEQLYEAFVGAAREAAEGYEADISVLGLSGYQFGFIPLDEHNEPLMGMITLLDGRSRASVPRLSQLMPVEELYRKSGLPPMFTSLLAKILWLREEKPRILERVGCFADIKSFLISRLTGRLITEPSIAATTQMLNLAKMDWDADLVEAAGINTDQLAEVRSGDALIGELPEETADQLGLQPGVQLLPGLYDGGAMMVGMGGLSGREGICSLGTTTMLRICTGEPVLDDPAMRRLQTYPLFGGTWATGGGINNAGVVLQWCREQLLANESYQRILADAAEVPPGSEGLFCLPYLTGERDPRIGEDASGMFLGIRQQHGAAHFTRAILEGVVCTVNLIKEAAEANGIELEDIRICGSGSQSDLWCQIFADLCGVPVVRSAEHDATLTGTAMLAATATGAYPDLQTATEKMVEAGETFRPSPDRQATYRRTFECFQDLLTDARDLYATHSRHMAEDSP